VVGAVCRRAADAVAHDLRAFARQVRVAFGSGRTRPGLYTHRVHAKGGKRRLHLRVHEDGSGALFADVTHVLHLTPTATEIARMLLDGVSAGHVRRLMRAWYPEEPTGALEAELGALESTVTALRDPATCPSCLPELERQAVFSHRAEAPYKADLALTYACNNACAHCYNEPGRKGMAPLDVGAWKSVLDRLARIGVPHIIFTGGEPTLHEGLSALVRHAEKLGQVTGINTNGRRLAKAGFAEELARVGLDHVQVTVASHLPEAHNATVRATAHGETVEGIRNALAAGLHTITNTTLTRENREQALETVRFVHELGVRTFAMNGMICSGGGRENPSALTEAELVPILEDVIELAGELGMRFLWYTPTEYCRLSPVELGLGAKACNAAEYSICIEPNGDVLPCQSYYEPVGNLLRDSWTEIWESPLFLALRNRREDPAGCGLPEECIDCEELSVCGGGCPLQRTERLEEAAAHG